jgi:hypothetical protein
VGDTVVGDITVPPLAALYHLKVTGAVTPVEVTIMVKSTEAPLQMVVSRLMILPLAARAFTFTVTAKRPVRVSAAPSQKLSPDTDT